MPDQFEECMRSSVFWKEMPLYMLSKFAWETYGLGVTMSTTPREQHTRTCRHCQAHRGRCPSGG